MTDTSGRQVTSTTCGDSYAADVFRPVADPDSRHLISPSGCVSQTSVGRILEGGGLLGSVSTANRFDSGLAEVTFEIHLIVFVDGEIAGPDPNRFAAEFVAKRIRMAQAEGSDVTPILTALAEAPSLGALGSPQCDPLFHSVQHYAREYLRHMHRKIGNVDMAEATLRSLENRPALPKFYCHALPAAE